jgi:hypothetical protein
MRHRISQGRLDQIIQLRDMQGLPESILEGMHNMTSVDPNVHVSMTHFHQGLSLYATMSSGDTVHISSHILDWF